MILENIVGLARPGRTVARAPFATDTAFSLLPSAPQRVSAHPAAPCELALCRRADQGSDGLATYCPSDVAFGKQIEHDNRQLVVHAEAECGRIRDFKAAFEDLALGVVGEHR